MVHFHIFLPLNVYHLHQSSYHFKTEQKIHMINLEKTINLTYRKLQRSSLAHLKFNLISIGIGKDLHIIEEVMRSNNNTLEQTH